MDVLEYVKKVKKEELDVEDSIRKILIEAKKVNKEYNYFNVISEDLALEQVKNFNKKGMLAGVPVSVKDNVCVKGVESTAGSKILKGYKPTFNAFAVQRIIGEGGIIIGKTSQDEFGFGSFSVNVGIDFKIPKNPFDKGRVTGGSSGGSGGWTAITKNPHISLGESTGGSIEAPASFCGVVGLCPTYGLVSRYGLIDYASSLDKMGPMAKTVDEAFLMLDVIKGHDERDSTSLKNINEENGDVKKIGLIKESKDVDSDVLSVVEKKLEDFGVEEVSLPLVMKYGVPTYYLIAMSEASTNLARYCGIRYGAEEDLKGEGFDQYFSRVRSNNFGLEAKRRVMLGTFARMAGYRDAYYVKATKVREMIIDEYKKALSKYDVLVSPTMSTIAPKFSEVDKLSPLQNYMMDALTAGPNLAGMPHMSINAGFVDKMPVGMMFIADHLKEEKLRTVGKKVDDGSN